MAGLFFDPPLKRIITRARFKALGKMLFSKGRLTSPVMAKAMTRRVKLTALIGIPSGPEDEEPVKPLTILAI